MAELIVVYIPIRRIRLLFSTSSQKMESQKLECFHMCRPGGGISGGVPAAVVRVAGLAAARRAAGARAGRARGGRAPAGGAARPRRLRRRHAGQRA